MGRRCLIPVLLVLLCLSCALRVRASERVSINGVEITPQSVPWTSDSIRYADELFEAVWGMSRSWGADLLSHLSEAQRGLTPENAELFIKSAVPGAVLRLGRSARDKGGSTSHAIFIAEIYDEGFVAYETDSKSAFSRFYSWAELCGVWAAEDGTTVFASLIWPDAPVLSLGGEEQESGRWLLFAALCAAGLVLFLILAAFLGRKTGTDTPPGIGWLKGFVFAAPFLLGLFFVWGSALASLFLLLYLAVLRGRTGRLRFSLTPGLLLTALLPICYAAACFWAADQGLAPFGVIKFLPLPLFLLALRQHPEEDRTALLRVLPWSGAVMTVLCAPCMLLPVVRAVVTVDGRLAGLFQYPNTFALFLLLGLLLLSDARTAPKPLPRILLALILAAGLLLSGSRTVFVLAVIFGLLRGLTAAGKAKWRLLAVTGGFAVLALILALALPHTAVGRFFRITLSSSTLQGRLLYALDALPQILRHPFGLGYLGYYCTQSSFQTGVYSAMFVHNDALQVFLDVGWLPGLGALAVLARQLLRKGVSWQQRLTVGAIAVHSLFDFDLQFVAVGLCLILCCAPEQRRERSLRGGWLRSAGALLAALCVSLGAASFSETYLSPELTLRLYPNDTTALLQQLSQAETQEGQAALGKRILSLDPSAALAYDALAESAWASGDVAAAVEAKQQAIACAPYRAEEYRDLFDKLRTAYELYLAQDAPDSAQWCADQLRALPEQMQRTQQNTSTLAWRLRDSPELTLTTEQQAYLESITNP